MAKTVLIIHGWPQSVTRSHPLYQFFLEKGYEICSPYFFDDNYPCTLEGIRKEVEKELDGREPEVIVGISMGGLVLPYIAKDFPKAKLVFIATGPYLRARLRSFNLLLRLAGQIWFFRFFTGLLNFWHKKVLYRIYELFNPIGKGNRRTFVKDMKQNIVCITKIPPEKENEIVKLATSLNNIKLIKELLHKSLIFAGEKDQLMPLGLGKKLRRWLRNSQLIITPGSHFNVFTEENLKDLDCFLK